jgi:hypothetical protein
MLRLDFCPGLPDFLGLERQVRISITQSPVVRVQCSCGLSACVTDLEAAVIWTFHESIRHGKGWKIDVLVDITLHAENYVTQTDDGKLGII